MRIMYCFFRKRGFLVYRDWLINEDGYNDILVDLTGLITNLRAVVAGRDGLAELGRFLNRTLEVYSEFLQSVHRAVKDAEALKDDRSSGTTQSAAALYEITRNMNSMTDEFSRLNERIEIALRSIKDIDGRIRRLSENIGSQSLPIDESSTSIQTMNALIREVTRLSEDRQDAIESARADEAGRGFAVVAEEVCKLSESTGEDATQIDHLLKSTISTMREARQASQIGADSFERVSSDVGLFQSAMSEISGHMRDLSSGSSAIVVTTEQIGVHTKSVDTSAGEISDHAEKIVEAMEQAGSMSATIISGMNEIDEGVKEVLTAINDIASLADENRDKMPRLSEVVATFKTEE